MTKDIHNATSEDNTQDEGIEITVEGDASAETHAKQEAQPEDAESQGETADDLNEADANSGEADEETDPLASAEAKIAELNDKLLRQMAEFDNYRKRTLKEKTELILNGGEKVMTSLLPVLDDLERALVNMEKSDDVATLREGVELIADKLYKTLAQQGLNRIETEGKEFNTDEHEAIALVPTGKDEDKGKVIDCVQTGYRLNEKVIRHAKVAVGQ